MKLMTLYRRSNYMNVFFNFMSTIFFINVPYIMFANLTLLTIYKTIRLKREVVCLAHLNRTSIFSWCVRLGEDQTQTCSERDWTMSSKFHQQFSPIIYNDREEPCNKLKNQHTCTSDNQNWISGSLIVQVDLCWCFIVDLPMQYKFRHANLIDRSWRTNWVTSTNPNLV